MRLQGFFHPQSHAPYIAADVEQEALGISDHVDFLVDSGASSTVIADRDAIKLGIDHSKLEQLPRGMRGVGGSVDTSILPGVKLLFPTEDGLHEEELERIYVMRHPFFDPRKRGIPSLLGRDVLNKYSVLLQYATNTVLITNEDIA